MIEKNKPADSSQDRASGLGFWHLVVSVLAAAIGVQKKTNLEKDFSQSSPMPYIIAGVVFTALFLGTLILIVSWVLGD